VDIHEDDIGPEALGLFHGFEPIPGRPYHPEGSILVE
jgi:hypothetical protein